MAVEHTLEPGFKIARIFPSAGLRSIAIRKNTST
jgi:hypothetical protein